MKRHATVSSPRSPFGARLMRTGLALVVGCGFAVGCKTQSNENVSRPIPQQKTPANTTGPLMTDANAAMAAGNTEEALRLLAAAIEQNPELTAAHMMVGNIEREQGNYEQAEKAYRTAAAQEPRNFDAQYLHGLTLHYLNRLGDAVRAYLRALAIRPDDFDANLNLATAYHQLDEPAQGLPYAERAVTLNPNSGPAHANLGAIYAALDRYEEAVVQYQAAAEMMDLTPELLVNLANALGKLDRYPEMVNTLDAVIEMAPSAAAYERLGFARFKLRQYDGAEAAFQKAIELDPRHYPALNGLGVCILNQYLAGGRADDALRREAVELFRRSLRINPRQPKIVELLTRFG